MTRISFALAAVPLFVVAALGCSASVGTTGGNPCARASHPAECNAPCGGSSGGVCSPGFYCASNRCTADCDFAAGAGCTAPLVCGADGRCGMGGPDGSVPTDFGGIPTDGPGFDNTCADVMLDGSHVTPNVIILVDRSGSMSRTFDMGMSRWQVLQNALIGTTGLITTLQHSVRFGLAMFTGRGTMCPDLITVLPPALDNLTPITTAYTAVGPGTNTPTGASMSALVTTLGGMTLPPGPTYIILATDGEPNTCTDTMDTVGGQMMSVAAAAAAAAAGYHVDAIGVSTDVALANLTLVAMAGGGTAYAVTDTATLATALNTIIGGAVSCDVMLSGMVDPSAACSGVVMLAGMPLACEDPNGFHVVDSTHITLQGTACAQLMSSGGTLTASFPCTAILH